MTHLAYAVGRIRFMGGYDKYLFLGEVVDVKYMYAEWADVII